MSNLAPSDILNLKNTKTKGKFFNKTNLNHQKEISIGADLKNDSESFLNSLLASIEKTNEFLPDHMKISQKEVVNEALNKLQIGSFDESDKISIFEDASFMQILSLLDKLKLDTSEVKFSNLSSQLTQLIKTENNFNALKGASNLSELLDIAKNLSLNVKNIKVDRLLDLKASFPNLDKNDFFKGSVENVFKEIVNNKIAHINKNLNENLNQKTNEKSSTTPNDNYQITKNKKINTQENYSLLSKTLQNLDTILEKKETKQEVTGEILKNNKNILQTNSTKTHFIEDNQSSNDIKNNSSKSLPKNQEDTTKYKEISEIEIKNTIDKKEVPLSKKQPENDKSSTIKNEIIETVLTKKSDDNVKYNLQNEKPLIKENIQESKILSSNLNTKELYPNTIKEQKEAIKDLKNNIQTIDQKINTEIINKTQTVNFKDDNFSENFLKDLLNENSKQNTTNTEEQNDSLNSLIKDLSKINQNQTKTTINPKETLQHFSENLKEAVEQYKAPITKLSITLNPSNLGEVEVTLVQRGNNLHINFNSNTNAMNIFIQHQAEFKNSLVNMGFTGLEMNFSDQQKKDQNQNKSRNHYTIKEKAEEEKENINLEMVLAKYF